MKLPQVEIEPTPLDWRGLPERFANPGEIERMVTLLRELSPRRMAEFGVNTGRTARLLLDNVPSLEGYVGVDVMPGYEPPLRLQRAEVSLWPGRFCSHDQRFMLIVTAHGTADVSPADLGYLDAAFIDGDHSREGVERDSWLARATIRHGVIVWHDYHDQGTVAVADVLHDMRAAGHDIRHIAGTWLAFERV